MSRASARLATTSRSDSSASGSNSLVAVAIVSSARPLATSGLVLGTGDLSELALGWCTYGVGDHMSHYNVNASVPKTLMQFLIRWVAGTDRFGDEASAVRAETRPRKLRS